MARRKFGVTRQAINRHIQTLVADGLLVSVGQTSGTQYRRAKDKREWWLDVAGLAEHEVWGREVAPLLEGHVPQNVLSICEYGFTEMLNNVIDHSGSPLVCIECERSLESVSIDVQDFGIGIFNKIQTVCGLEDARHAVFELTKGKLTTDPDHHTGEGVFFTSRMFDSFSISSGGLFLGHSRDSEDWLLGDKDEQKKGTLVSMLTSPVSTHTVQEVFDRYATEQDDYAFNKTHVVVKLSDLSDRFTSRSQGKRIVARLERFKEVVLDFANVQEVGPAFADQVFRVFAKKHPETHLVPVNSNEQVTKMIMRALAQK